jgi:P-type Cu2+ transporter
MASPTLDLGPPKAPPSPRATAARAAVSGVCAHCGTTLDDTRHAPYCCEGCGAVAALLRDGGLERYYDLRDGAIAPTRNADAPRDLAWLEPLEARAKATTSPSRIDLDLQGIQCTACVWLLEELFRRAPHALHAEINPAIGHASLLVSPGFDLRAYVVTAARLGYRFGPTVTRDASVSRRGSALVGRLGVCAALAINTMIFALPLYLGLNNGPTHSVFRWITLALSTASVVVGGSVFIRSAFAAIRRRILHLDVPIALGIIAAYSGSLLHHIARRDGAAYFDTVSVFIALMLLGRWLQARATQR